MIKDIRRLLDALTYFYVVASESLKGKPGRACKHTMDWQEHEQTVVEFNCLRSDKKCRKSGGGK